MTASEIPLWEQRYRAAEVTVFDWSPRAPDRVVFVSDESGIRQVHALDRSTGRRRRVTDHPVGVVEGVPTFDGRGVLWFQDETGDESGRWFRQPFDGGEAAALPGFPVGWSEGLAQAPGVIAAVVSDRDGFGVHVSIDGAPAREIYRHEDWVGIGSGEMEGFARGGLSADGTLLCLEHTEGGDLIHPALRVVDTATGRRVGEQRDDGLALSAACWAPVAGDQRLAIVHEREGERRPAIWNLATSEVTDVRVELPGVVEIWDWWPGGDSVLVLNHQRGRTALYRLHLGGGECLRIDTPPGAIARARVRPDGTLWYHWSSGDQAPRVLADSGEEVLRAEGDEAPQGRSYADWDFPNPKNQSVHGFYVSPGGDGPFPTVMLVHGGPTWADADRWDPEVQAYVDAGFAVGMVNYRGSTGYGREWRDELIGDIGGPDMEDVNAGLADLVGRGLADPERCVIAGWSWGGYITLLNLGKHPDLWACGVAGVPVGDYEACYEDLSPMLQAYDRALLGAPPRERPDLMRDRNPINFVDNVSAPALLIVGENDTRCPYRQAIMYADRLKARGHPHEVYTFSTGHGSFAVEEQVRQMRVILDFLVRNVPGVGIQTPAS